MNLNSLSPGGPRPLAHGCSDTGSLAFHNVVRWRPRYLQRETTCGVSHLTDASLPTTSNSMLRYVIAAATTPAKDGASDAGFFD